MSSNKGEGDGAAANQLSQTDLGILREKKGSGKRAKLMGERNDLGEMWSLHEGD
jgi:hypothetical protein